MTPLMAIAVVAVAGVAIVIALVAGVLVARARAQTAADAAALAGAVEGRQGAEDLATRNGARLVGFTVDGPETEVEVAIGPVTASARAERRR